MNKKIFFILFLMLLLTIAGCEQGCQQKVGDGSSLDDDVSEKAVRTQRDSQDSGTGQYEEEETTAPSGPIYEGDIA